MFSFLSPPAELSSGVAAIEVPMGHNHVTFRELGVGLITLLQYHKCVPHVVVHKTDSEVSPTCILPPKPLQRVPNNAQIIQEGNLVVVGFLGLVGGYLPFLP